MLGTGVMGLCREPTIPSICQVSQDVQFKVIVWAICDESSPFTDRRIDPKTPQEFDFELVFILSLDWQKLVEHPALPFKHVDFGNPGDLKRRDL